MEREYIMPNYIYTDDNWTVTTDSYSWLSSDPIQQMWEEHQQECERQDREIQAMMQRQAELIEDKRKYPLFFLKEGIV